MRKTATVKLATVVGFAIFLSFICMCSFGASDSEAETVDVQNSGEGKVTYTLTESGGGNYATVTSLSSLGPKGKPITILATVTKDNVDYRVSQIDPGVFSGNKKVTALTIEPNEYLTLPSNMFGESNSYLKTVTIGDKITEISDGAFAGCTALTTVDLPNTVTSIGNRSFYGCYALSTIDWPEGLIIIGPSAFKGCMGLSSINLGNALETIGEGAFQGCSGINTITLPDNVKAIGSSVFQDCTQLSSITLDDNLESIGAGAFYNTAITTLVIPAKVNSIELTGISVFPAGLTNLTVDGNNQAYVCENDMLLDKHSDTIIFAFNVPEEFTLTKNVGPNVFSNKGITRLVVNDTVTMIGDSAFSNNANLTEISLSSSIIAIGEGAFSNCPNLVTLNLEDGLTVVGGFAYCTGLIGVSLPNSIQTIQDSAFRGCTNLEVSLPASLTVVGSNAFDGCTALAASELPSGVTEIRANANVKITSGTVGAGSAVKLSTHSLNLIDAENVVLNNVTCENRYEYASICFNTDNCTITLGDGFKLWKWQGGLGVSLDGRTVFMKQYGYYGDVILPATTEEIIGEGFRNYNNNCTEWKIDCEDSSTTVFLDSGIELDNASGVFFHSEYLTSVNLPNVVVNEGNTFNGCIRLTSFNATSLSQMLPNTFNGTKITELNLVGCKRIVGPIQTANTSLMTLFIINSDLETAWMSTPGYTFYNCSGEQILFSQGANMLSDSVQASLIKGKMFYSPEHNRTFYEVTEDEIILVTEKSTGNTYQKIAKADRYDGITGSGQVYRIADGKALLTLHVGDELIYVAVDKGTVSDLAIPTKTGHNFQGWFTDSEYSSSFDTSAAINADQVLYAKFTIAQYTITFDTAGGSAIAAITQDYDSDVVAPAAPTRTGYTFAGWSAEVPAKMPVDGMTLTASWNINQYTITFDTAGGSAIAAITQDYNTSVTAPVVEPSRDGYRFVRWDSEIPASMPADNVIIKAVWAIVATVSENGKSIVTLDSETSSFIPAAETKEITVEIRENTAVKVENASDLIGKTVVSKVEPVSNSTGVSGTAYEFTFTADGTQYNGKIQVTLPYTKEAGKEPVVYYWNGSESTKMNVVSSTDTSVTFETDHNSMYVVASETPSKDDGLSFLLFFGLLMVVGIAVSMLVGFNFYRKKA